jgi:hypothetical protein
MSARSEQKTTTFRAGDPTRFDVMGGPDRRHTQVMGGHDRMQTDVMGRHDTTRDGGFDKSTS